MKPLKPIHLKILSELMRDSSRSNRQIAKTVKISQPTVTRNRRISERIEVISTEMKDKCWIVSGTTPIEFGERPVA